MKALIGCVHMCANSLYQIFSLVSEFAVLIYCKLLQQIFGRKNQGHHFKAISIHKMEDFPVTL